MSKRTIKPFNEREHIVKSERNLFLGNKKDFKIFKSMLDIPITVKSKTGRRTKSEAVFTCNTPLQIRIMGNVDDVRVITKKLIKVFELPFEKDAEGRVNKSPNTSELLLTKLEYDKSNRVGNFCKNTIRAFIKPQSITGQPNQVPKKEVLNA